MRALWLTMNARHYFHRAEAHESGLHAAETAIHSATFNDN